jgi:cell division transport system permease protein
VNLRSIEFQIIETLTNIRRNGLMTLAAVTTAAACLLALGVFALILWNVRAAAEESASGVRIVVYCNKSVEVSEAKQLSDSIQGRFPGLIRETRVVPKEQVLEEAGKQLNTPVEGLESDEYNPFGPTVELAITDPSRWEEVVAAARGDARVADVVSGGKILSALVQLRDFGRVGGGALVVLLSLAALLTISNTIRLTIYARRREIRIMQIVGATVGFIRAPFIMEGVFHGCVGGLIATATLLPLYLILGNWLANTMPAFGRWLVFGTLELTSIFGGVILLGSLFGAIGSWISVRRYLE